MPPCKHERRHQWGVGDGFSVAACSPASLTLKSTPRLQCLPAQRGGPPGGPAKGTTSEASPSGGLAPRWCGGRCSHRVASPWCACACISITRTPLTGWAWLGSIRNNGLASTRVAVASSAAWQRRLGTDAAQAQAALLFSSTQCTRASTTAAIRPATAEEAEAVAASVERAGATGSNAARLLRALFAQRLVTSGAPCHRAAAATAWSSQDCCPLARARSRRSPACQMTTRRSATR